MTTTMSYEASKECSEVFSSCDPVRIKALARRSGADMSMIGGLLENINRKEKMNMEKNMHKYCNPVLNPADPFDRKEIIKLRLKKKLIKPT